MTSTAANAELQLEFDATAQGINLLSDSGDHKKFTSGVMPWSRLSAHTPEVRPNGLATGGTVIPAVSGSNNVVDTAALTCWLAGILTSVAADTDVTVTRAAGGGDEFIINSITVDSAGTIAVVAGTDGTGIVETRAAAGGPPLIPVGSIEIAQVRLTSSTAAPVVASEIYAVAGLHKELAGSPVWTVDYANGWINFVTALPLIHTGPTARRVYASYSMPNFAELPDVTDYVPPEQSFTLNTTQVYKRTIGAATTSLNQGTWTAYFTDNGIRDNVLTLIGERIWTKFYQDPVGSSDHILANGILGVTRSFPPGDNVSGSFTHSADAAGQNVYT